MKLQIKNIFILAAVVLSFLGATSCNDFLDREPLSSVTPEAYFKQEADLAAYSINLYGTFVTHDRGTADLGPFITGDMDSDLMCDKDPNLDTWVYKRARVPETSDDYRRQTWDSIRSCNYFLEKVLPNFENKIITGSEANIKHYIGEIYTIRAHEYFKQLQAFGDFPIVTTVLDDKEEQLVEASKRQPRNMVARFIIEDLDRAISMLKSDMNSKKRITKDLALLLKARVALYEASWLTYHKGTPFVPGGPDWPGAKAPHNSGFLIDIDKEIDFFLTTAMAASQELADKIALTANTGVMSPDNTATGWNSYFEMFGDMDMSKYPEVLLWRTYNQGLGIHHGVGTLTHIGSNSGLTRALIDGFLMKDGLPIYASTDYKGNVTTNDLKTGRDERLQLFLWGEYDKLTLNDTIDIYPGANIVTGEKNDMSGYRLRKFYNFDPKESPTSGSMSSYGCPVFRAAEAYLIYMEASYMKNNSIDATADKYWKAIRTRAGIDPDYNKTIAATDLLQEKDWAVYSAGKKIDETLYNIRRERKNEMFAENLRWSDLKRWRALDQVDGYIVEGYNLWDEAYNSIVNKDKDGKSLLIEPGTAGKTANVSARTDSKHLRPYRINTAKSNELYNGYKWTKANYLKSFPVKEIRAAAPGGDLSASGIYQNPYWSTTTGETASE